ncbi:TonB-dependent receptor [Caulobacter sp. Root1455]|uniref:TonB-dependent receptor n=1 Tax=Caulobacter sp. Root1455 TaxID=1736465 RepID=UPI0009EA59C5|nr:TonB-dependent receptor [Caulobacter sp. Root1455]
MVQTLQSRALRLALIGASCLTGLAAAPAFAQQAAPAASNADTVEEVVVTGFRKSLTDATNAKRDSIAFTDSVFAEDIGKFPDLNIAESLNRIPGIQLTREINGDGLNIAVRGLGTNFTKILLNGSQIAVASSGRTDAQNQNREVDLNLFPTELFTRLDVSKTPMASQVEGGVAGVVNMRNARPFDRAGRHFTYSLQGGYQESAGKWSPRGAILASDTWDTSHGEFGLLLGYAGARTKSRTDGFETIGWTNANLTYAQCGTTPPAGTAATAISPACNSAVGGNGYRIPDTVPATAGNGLVAGTPITAAYLQSLNPGTTAQQLGDGIIPRLGRQSYSEGTRNRDSVLISGEWRPNDALAFYSDLLLGQTHNDFNRLDMDWIVRNSGGMVPMNVKVDANNVVTKGTFANSQFFLEARPYDEKTDFYNFNPGGSWQINPWLLLDGQFNLSRSVFFREAPTILVNSPAGLTVDFDNTGGDMPLIKTGVNLNDPNLGWTFAGGRLNIQNEKRVTSNKGTHWNLKIGEDSENYIKVGVAYDDISRSIQALDNSGAWQTFTCGGGLVNNAVPSPTPPCNGQAGSAITQAQLASYLRPGPIGFITVDYDSFKAASSFDRFNETAPAVSSAATAASSGFIEEENIGAYIEANAVTQIMDRDLAFNFGGRYVTTDQTIRGPQTVNGVTSTLERQTTYDAFLPAFNAVYKVRDDVNLRMAASRTITRANPSAMLPGTTFSDVSAQTASQGNPALSPYTSNNFDMGGEWYTGGAGYVGVALFQKVINGFTVQGTNTIPFTQLGVAYANLTTQQQQAIDLRGGPNVATVTVNQQVNAGGTLTIRGYELNWVQPLDFLIPGTGFTANYTRINQTGSGSGAPAVAVGVSPYTYNLTGYYEGHGASIRLSYNYNDAQISSDPNQQSIPVARLKTDAYKQVDLSASYQLPWKHAPQITFNAINITDEVQRQTFQYSNAAFTYYKPGSTYLIGIRGQF